MDADKEGNNSPCESAHTVFATQGLRVISKEYLSTGKGEGASVQATGKCSLSGSPSRNAARFVLSVSSWGRVV